MAKQAAYDDPQKAIDYLMNTHKMRPKEIADATGVDRTTIWRIRHGKTQAMKLVRERLRALAEQKRDNMRRRRRTRRIVES